MRKISLLFNVLAKSTFRQRFHLNDQDKSYLIEKGLVTILQHGHDFIQQRLVMANPSNDGKQTPMRGHPIFVAQHATATCCRGCLQQWHQIPKDKPLNDAEIEHILTVLEHWLRQELQA